MGVGVGGQSQEEGELKSEGGGVWGKGGWSREGEGD